MASSSRPASAGGSERRRAPYQVSASGRALRGCIPLILFDQRLTRPTASYWSFPSLPTRTCRRQRWEGAISAR